MPPSLRLTDRVEPDPALIGAKAASLVVLRRGGFRVPDAVFLTTGFFAPWIDALETMSTWYQLRDLLAGDVVPDPASLEPLCATLRRRASALELDDVQRRTLDQVAESVDGHLVAVRSSSPEEDLAGASFAGVYESVLNVHAAELDGAVRRCFASCVDTRVILYKAERRLDPIPRFAAIVQRQTASEVSGVAFSLNPHNNDFDEAVINATWGLGEALVSGQIEPDRWLIDKVDGRTIESRPGSKGGRGADAFCLDDTQLGAVTTCVGAIETLFDKPVDIEWTFAEGELHILQARPITTYVPLPKAMQTEPGEPRILYLDPSLGEGITISGAVSPLSVDLFARLFEWAGDHLFGLSLLDSDPQRGLVGASGTRLYGNVSNLMHVRDLRKAAHEKRFVDTTLAELLATIDLEPYRTQPPPNFAKRRLLAALVKALVRMAPFFRALLLAISRPGVFLTRHRDELAAFDRQVGEIDGEAPILEFAQRLYAAVGRVSLIATAPAMVVFIYRGTDALMRLTNGLSAHDRRLAMDIRSGGDELVLEMGLAMFRLARMLPADAFTDLEALARLIDSRRMPAGFLTAWDDFGRRFGCRGPLEMDLANPKYGDDSGPLLRQLAVLSSGESDPIAAHAERVAARKSAYAELAASLGKRKRRKLARIYATIRDFEQVREMPKHHMAMVNMVLRQRLLRTAADWVAAGRLDRAGDVFEMSLDDVAHAEADADLDLRAVVAERGAFYRDARMRVRHFPHLIDSRGRILRPLRNDRPGELKGVAVSPGIARGPVKLLDTPFDKALAPGDVLVAHTTDPGWTPLFVNAAAVLLEVGGELQHGALIAREYGKPCIAGIAGLTDKLRDGQMVEVDGDAGVVTFDA